MSSFRRVILLHSQNDSNLNLTLFMIKWQKGLNQDSDIWTVIAAPSGLVNEHQRNKSVYIHLNSILPI